MEFKTFNPKDWEEILANFVKKDYGSLLVPVDLDAGEIMGLVLKAWEKLQSGDKLVVLNGPITVIGRSSTWINDTTYSIKFYVEL